jgi:hypothetical protein
LGTDNKLEIAMDGTPPGDATLKPSGEKSRGLM